MLTRKPCKHCGSIWHSKNKCSERPKQPLPEGFIQKRTQVHLSAQNASERLRTRHRSISDRSVLIKEADRVHSAYIRSISNICYTCDRTTEGIQNGHFMPRRYLNTRWDNMNCHPQCNDCNVTKSGNLKVYEKRLRVEYGDSAIDALKKRAKSGNKVTATDIQKVIDNYRVAFF